MRKILILLSFFIAHLSFGQAVSVQNSELKYRISSGQVRTAANKDSLTSLKTVVNGKQTTLVSGTNIKTIESNSLLGSGNIDLSKADVGLANVDNTTDLNKPISTATQTALNGKFTTPTGLTSGTLSKWNGTTYVNSLITDNGTTVAILNDATINGVRVGLGNFYNTGSLAVGLSALNSNLSGIDNSAIGSASLLNLTSGDGVTALGRMSGRFIADGVTPLTSASYSLFLGRDTRPNGQSQTNQIVIAGTSTIGLGSNTTVLGNSSTTFGRWYGNLLLGSNTNSGEALQVTGTSKLVGNTAITGTLSVSSTVTIPTLSATNDATINSILVGRSGGNISSNVAVGLNSLVSNTTGNQNISIGENALNVNTTGSNIVAIGRRALFTNTTGENLVAIGSGSGRYISGGVTSNLNSTNSVFVGAFTYPLADNQTNQNVFGYNTIGLGSNTSVIGNSSSIQTHLYGTLTIGTGTTPAASAIADFQSTTKGFLPPRMTTAQRTAISIPAEGLCVYDTTLHKLYVYDGTTWQAAW